jgi:hypothetical protein
MKTSSLSRSERRGRRHDTLGTGGPQTASFSAANFVAFRGRSHRYPRQRGFVHLNIIDFHDPKASSDTCQIR